MGLLVALGGIALGTVSVGSISMGTAASTGVISGTIMTLSAGGSERLRLLAWLVLTLAITGAVVAPFVAYATTNEEGADEAARQTRS